MWNKAQVYKLQLRVTLPQIADYVGIKKYAFLPDLKKGAHLTTPRNLRTHYCTLCGLLCRYVFNYQLLFRTYFFYTIELSVIYVGRVSAMYLSGTKPVLPRSVPFHQSAEIFSKLLMLSPLVNVSSRSVRPMKSYCAWPAFSVNTQNPYQPTNRCSPVSGLLGMPQDTQCIQVNRAARAGFTCI